MNDKEKTIKIKPNWLYLPWVSCLLDCLCQLSFFLFYLPLQNIYCFLFIAGDFIPTVLFPEAMKNPEVYIPSQFQGMVNCSGVNTVSHSSSTLKSTANTTDSKKN